MRTLRALRSFFDLNQLTSSQQALVTELEAFFESDDHVFLLLGGAGTGKTFMAKGIAQWLQHRDLVLHHAKDLLSFSMMAYTGRAALILETKTGFPARTIHSSIYSFEKNEEISEGVKNSEFPKPIFRLGNGQHLTPDYCCIIDECSMIPDHDQEQESIQFGTNRLLADWVTYTRINKDSVRRKAIFIGDPSQLPPVGASTSPAQDPGYLNQEYNLRTRQFTLHEIVRQAEGSNIIQQAAHLRACLEKRDSNIQFKMGGEVIDERANNDIGRLWDLKPGVPPDAEKVFITHSNQDAYKVNEAVRRYCFKGDSVVQVGEILLNTKNTRCFENLFLNGELFIVDSVDDRLRRRTLSLRSKSGENTKVELVFRKLLIRSLIKKAAEPVSAYIYEPFLYNGESELTHHEKQALYVDFKLRMEMCVKKIKPQTAEFDDALASDPYFNCLKMKFGYAMTCYKAQGGEWPDVYVNLRQQYLGTSSESFLRWAYTAVTRASKRLHVLDFAEKEAVKVFDNSIEVTTPSEFDKWGIAVAPSSRELVAAAIYNALLPHYPNCSRPNFMPYQIRLHPAPTAPPVEVYYDGKFQVSTIMPGSPEISDLLAPLKGKPLRAAIDPRKKAKFNLFVSTAVIPLIKGQFLEALEERLRGNDIRITSVSEDQYCDAYAFRAGEQQVTVKFYFKKGGVYSKPMVVEGGDPDLSQFILEALKIQLI